MELIIFLAIGALAGFAVGLFRVGYHRTTFICGLYANSWCTGLYVFWGADKVGVAKLGVKMAHLLSPQILKKCFAVLLLIVGCFFLFKGLL